MSFWYVFLMMQVIFAVLLACPVVVEASFQNELSARIGFLFFHYTVAPRPPEKEKTEKQKQKEEEKAKQHAEKHQLRELFQKKGLSGFLEILSEAAKLAGTTARNIFRHIVFKRFWLRIAVGGEDAAQTALDYGRVCGVVGTAAGMIFQYAKYQEYHITIVPDFHLQKSLVTLELKAHIKLFFLLNTLLGAFFKSMKLVKAAAADS